ncbi:hypothetical protein NM208_g14710 [Fusarium decemcellulare]|uniref:Uncharacterized protein n=1 Tax=Fusarium decemcellulare TaxID=57161 RepID=A0ACC1RFR9_9HYPO|nr:hypothetical protein NM208_g14710 [Fusarium decemcellulare]
MKFQLSLNPSWFRRELERRVLEPDAVPPWPVSLVGPNMSNAMEFCPPALDDPETESSPSPNFSGFGILINVTRPLPPCYVDPETQNSRPHQYLFDLYYDNFHATHSWLPPKKSLSRLIEKIPGELNFLVTMILYVGSMYTDRVESTSLRADAYEMASGFLTPSVWSVQALLCMCVAAFGEQQDLCCSRWFDKTREMALSLGLHHKSFADEQEDPVLAESCRRAYWALYAHGSLRTVREHLGHWQLYTTQATTGLPCEEWEYETGNIPTPVTQAEYYRNGASQEYSSWAYLVDLTRICGRYILPLLNVWEQASPDAIEDANLLVESWILQLPVRKREFVDDNGAVDLILYHALGIAYGLQIRMQLNYRGVGPHIKIREVASHGYSILSNLPCPPPSAVTGSVTRLPGSKAVQAALHLVTLFNSHLPPAKLSPSCILGLERAALPLVDALLYRGGPPIYQVKISILTNVLKNAGEFWPRSKAVFEEIDEVMRTVRENTENSRQSTAMATMTDMFGSPSTYEDDDFNQFMSPSFSATGQIDPWTGMLPRSLKTETTTAEAAAWLGMTSPFIKSEEEMRDMVPLPGGSLPTAGTKGAELGARSGMPSSCVKAEGQWS